jgi:REP element-mobilizing transposase RayT
MDYFEEHRKSHMEIGKIYFWTATIHNWHKLLSGDATKQMITGSLSTLSARGKITIYAFVIMPNHIHLIWQMNALNGKETAQGSFLKFTAHAFQNHLLHNDPLFLPSFSVKAANKNYEFWQRDPLAFELTQKKTAMQKLQYIHDNPLAEHWQLTDDPARYYYSSAKYYETGIDDFGFLNDITAIF